MCESLERRRTVPNDLPYDLEEPGDERREITKGLMKLSEQSLHDFLAGEPDILQGRRSESSIPMKGDIVLVPFPNSDLSTWKRRPALVLYEDPIENETTIAYISSHTPIVPASSDVLITRETPSFDGSGLKWNSVIN